jgi:MFS transporter, OPA family, glycerol-3-phosphate transporter
MEEDVLGLGTSIWWISALAAAADDAEKGNPLLDSLYNFGPIAGLLLLVGLVIAFLPTVEGVNHSAAFKRRRVLNWLPLGLTYAFLYMGRYNLKISKFAFEEMVASDGSAMMGNDDFGFIFAVGTFTYGCAFLINGPITDRLGGRIAIIIGASGSAFCNMLMGASAMALLAGNSLGMWIGDHFVTVYSLLYAGNMYFQSYGAVAIVKVNAPWFHVRERGVFGAIFGILISLGVYFAFDWGYMIVNAESLGLTWVFFTPMFLLLFFLAQVIFVVRNTPADAGFDDFDTGDASSGMADEVGDDELWEQIQKIVGMVGLPPFALESTSSGRFAKGGVLVMHRVYYVFVAMLTNRIVLTIACIEFCSGFLRQAIMQWFRTYAKQTDSIVHLKETMVYENWGVMLCAAGIMGGLFAGAISDHVFQSRRGPVAAVLYGLMLVGSIALLFAYDTAYAGWLVVFMSMCVIGVHGMLSGTASMDFGGRKNVGVAVGIIDGFVYLGTGVMSLTYGIILPKEQFDMEGQLIGPATDPANWIGWPLAMIPMAALGLVLCTRIWNAKPKSKSSAGH